MLERTWSYRHLYGNVLDGSDLDRNTAFVIVALLDAAEDEA